MSGETEADEDTQDDEASLKTIREEKPDSGTLEVAKWVPFSLVTFFLQETTH